MMPSLPPGRVPHDPSADLAAASTPATKPGLLSWRRFLIETVIVFGLAIPLALGLHTFVTQVYAISGSSMEPTLHDGERVVIDKLGPAFSDLETGEIVIFTSPLDPSKNLVKRVIGVEGDKISLRGDRVYLNEQPLPETYALRGLYQQDDEKLVPKGHIFVLGDNRPQSKDSRHFGSVECKSVRGRVLFRLWPLDAITAF